MNSNLKTLASDLISMAEACASMRTLKQIHARAISAGLHSHAVVLAKIFRFVAVSPAGDLRYAHAMFDQIHEPSGFFYNILIRGYSTSSSPCVSIDLFNRMRGNGVDHDGFTFTFLVKARSRMKLPSDLITGSDDIHALVTKVGLQSYLHVQNGLIHSYAMKGLPAAAQRLFDESLMVDIVSWSGLVVAYVKSGDMDIARRVFGRMPERDVVTWSAMISGYLQSKYPREALEVFREMKDSGTRPDEVTMVSIISACTNLGDLETGLDVHRYADQNGFLWMVPLCNALIDMYGKLGCIDPAWQIFNNMKSKSLITWNSMIRACANQGYGEKAFWLFNQMSEYQILPDGITFLALLTACTHKGWVDEGYGLFRSMEPEYGVQASVEHYGCVVDMLGRAGRLQEAYALILNMTVPCNDVVWGALLGACRTYGDIEMGKRVLKKLSELKPDEGGYFILLRDAYMAAGLTEEAYEVRRTIERTTHKNPGCSWAAHDN